MLISYRYKFIFIHNPKVAGVSIKKALRKYALNSPSTIPWLNQISEYTNLSRLANFYIFNTLPFVDNLSFHGIADSLRTKIGKNRWDHSFKFGFVRNPWDREVSLYHYILNKRKHYLNSLFKELGSFDAYIRWSASQERVYQKRFFYSPDGKLLVDFIGRFENLENDFNVVCDNLGINAQLPHHNFSRRNKKYRDYYSEETRDLVAAYYKQDIMQFEYEF